MAEPFRLERVLRVRAQLRKLRQHETEELAARLAGARVAAARLADERERCGAAEAADAAAGRLTPERLRVARDYERALGDAEMTQLAEVARLVAALERKRVELRRERQEEEKYVRLADAHRQRVLAEEARESERALDEIAIDRHRRGRKERSDVRHS